jgi:hypothetical protein
MIIRRNWDDERRKKKKKKSEPYEMGDELKRLRELPEEQNTSPRAAQSYHEIVSFGYCGAFSHDHRH